MPLKEKKLIPDFGAVSNAVKMSEVMSILPPTFNFSISSGIVLPGLSYVSVVWVWPIFHKSSQDSDILSSLPLHSKLPNVFISKEVAKVR
jgi:hypothetical protein